MRLRSESACRPPESAESAGIRSVSTPTHATRVWEGLITSLAHPWVRLEPPNLHATCTQPAHALRMDIPEPGAHYSGVATASGHALGIGGSIMGDPLAPNRVHSRCLGVQVDRQMCRLTPELALRSALRRWSSQAPT